MTKQEEIRGQLECIFGYPHLVEKALQYLHSQDVVIEREVILQGIKIPPEISFVDWAKCRDAMEKAGYVAVEPLIEEQSGKQP